MKVEIIGCCEAIIDTLDSDPGDPALEECVADVEAEMRKGLASVAAYDVTVSRKDMAWLKRIELVLRFKRLVSEEMAAEILAGMAARQETLN